MAAGEEDKAEQEKNNLVCEGLGEKCPACSGPCPEKIVFNDELALLTD